MSINRTSAALPIAAQTDPVRPRLRFRRSAHVIREIVETLVLIGVLYALVNLATARFVVEGLSMQPTFATGQYVIVSRVSYLFGEPQHGDVIVFHYPVRPTDDYIKRVIGTPGDLIEIRDGVVYRNDEPLNEAYINAPCTASSCREGSWRLSEDEFFVLGDNRNNSIDSRVFGAVPRENIVGEALLRYWPPQAWSLMPGAR